MSRDLVSPHGPEFVPETVACLLACAQDSRCPHLFSGCSLEEFLRMECLIPFDKVVHAGRDCSCRPFAARADVDRILQNVLVAMKPCDDGRCLLDLFSKPVVTCRAIWNDVPIIGHPCGFHLQWLKEVFVQKFLVLLRAQLLDDLAQKIVVGV